MTDELIIATVIILIICRAVVRVVDLVVQYRLRLAQNEAMYRELSATRAAISDLAGRKTRNENL